MGAGWFIRIWQRKGHVFMKKYGMMIGFLCISIIISVITPNFLSTRNILNILRQSSIVGIMAIGSTFVIIGGGFDISVGSLLALVSGGAGGTIDRCIHRVY